MSRESGGAAPREGFTFQDYAAAYYFIVSDHKAFRGTPEELHIEEDDADFSFTISDDGVRYKHFFESKHRSDGEIKWNEFKKEIAPELATIAERNTAEGIAPKLHIVTSCRLQNRLSKFLGDIDKARWGSINWMTFEKRHERTEVEQIKSSLDLNDETLYTLINGLYSHHHSRRELELELESYLQDCSPGQFRRAKELIMNRIGETGSGTISRRSLEREIGFDLDPVDDSTSVSESHQELKQTSNSIEQQYQTYESHYQGVVQDRTKITKYVQSISEQTDSSSDLLDPHSARLEEEFERLIEAERTTRAARQNIAQEIAAVKTYDSTDDSEVSEDD